MTFIIVCGGTAGHVNPGISIAEELRDRYPKAKILFIGADRDLEKRLVPRAGFELINIKMSGVRRGHKLKDIIYNIKTAINVMSAGRKAAKIFKEVTPIAVIGTGGYICYPVIKAAAKQKIPAFILESNAIPGMTVKMLSGIVNKVMITYPGYEKYYKRLDRIVVTGTPVRRAFTVGIGDSVKQPSQEFAEKPLVVSFWGSLGAERMNEIMAEFIKRNAQERCFYHIHATGSSKGRFSEVLAEHGVTDINTPYADVRDYIDEMSLVMGAADLVLCRAGGITLAEITALGKPSILVPSKYVPDNVQHENAKQLSQRGAAIVIQESECTADMLYETVSGLINNPSKLNEMSRASMSLAAPNATLDIVDLIVSETIPEL